jgi:hypothetical protein
MNIFYVSSVILFLFLNNEEEMFGAFENKEQIMAHSVINVKN